MVPARLPCTARWFDADPGAFCAQMSHAGITVAILANVSKTHSPLPTPFQTGSWHEWVRAWLRVSGNLCPVGERHLHAFCFRGSGSGYSRERPRDGARYGGIVAGWVSAGSLRTVLA